MIFKKEIQKPILSLIFISLGGWMMHYRIHPISENPFYYLPFITGLLNIIFVPVLFHYKKTAILAYLINGFSVIIGAILMAHLSLLRISSSTTLSDMLFKTTSAYIFISSSKLFIGQMILSYYYPTGLGRFFTAWWWTRHFVYLSAVYTLGFYLWR